MAGAATAADVLVPGWDAEGAADCAGVDPKLNPCGADVAAAVAPNRAGVAAAEEAPEAAAEAMPKDSGVEAGAAAAVLAGRGVLTAAANKGALGMLAEADAGVLDGVDGIWKPPGAALEVPVAVPEAAAEEAPNPKPPKLGADCPDAAGWPKAGAA